MILDQFDKTKPYYHLVYQYFINFYGSNILWSKQMIKDLGPTYDWLKNLGEWEDYLDGIDFRVEDRDYLKAGLPIYPELIMPYNLCNSFNNEKILIDDELMLDRGGDHIAMNAALTKMSNMVIVIAFEILPNSLKSDKSDSLINFLFHCRNAAAHGGHFHITSNKRFPANWNGLEILKKYNGLNLLLDANGSGFLSPMDIILLLLDVEKKYFNVIQ